MRAPRKITGLVLILIFVSIIYFPILNNKFNWIESDDSSVELLAPQFTTGTADTFPKMYEKHFEKTLAVQPLMVKLNSYFKILCLKTSPDPEKVLVGNNGWLYIGGGSYNEYLNKTLFTDDQLKKIKEEMHKRANYSYTRYHSKLYFIPAPLKHTIYPEYLPINAVKYQPHSRFDQVVDLFKDDTLVKVIDVRAAVMEHKKEHILFYKTDNHWNNYGGYWAYSKIMSVIQKDFPSVHKVGFEDLMADSSQVLFGGEAQLLNVGEIFHEQRYDLNPIAPKAKDGHKYDYKVPDYYVYAWDYQRAKETADLTRPNALFFRDSFTDALFPFFSESFNRSVYIFDNWQYKANYDVIDNEKPNIVVYIILENNLNRILEF